MDRASTVAAATAIVAVAVALVVSAATGDTFATPAAWTLCGVCAFVSIEVLRLSIVRRREARALDETTRLLRKSVTHDPLTGALNRVGVAEELGRRMAAGPHTPVGVITLDLHRLASVNQMLGHDRGDTLLAEIAERLIRAVGSGGTVGRLGADVFTVIVDDATPGRVDAVATSLARAVSRPVSLGEADVAVTATMGSATSDDATRPEDVLRASDLALEAAKERSPHRLVHYTRDLSDAAAERLRLIEELRSARSEGEFEVYFQPVVTLSDGRIAGAEALLRWNHPTKGIVDAAIWVDLASEIGLLPALGLSTIHDCCRHFATINATRPDAPLWVAVNLATPEVLAHGLVDHVQTTLEASRLDPSMLVLEVSESTITEPNVVSVLSELRGLGVRVAIDDFGTAPSSIDAMRSVAADQVKIDRAVIADVGTTRTDTAIVRAVIDMARMLGLEVVAEGITAEAQAEILRDMGGGLGQGYLYGRALPFTRFMSAIERVDRVQRDEVDAPGSDGSVEGAAAARAADESSDAVAELR
jgi:diguanylate cyclase (GGDEF)-like protein